MVEYRTFFSSSRFFQKSTASLNCSLKDSVSWASGEPVSEWQEADVSVDAYALTNTASGGFVKQHAA